MLRTFASLVLLAGLAPCQQLVFSPDAGRDATSLFAAAGTSLVLADLDGDGRDDAVSGPGLLGVHVQQPAGDWIDRGLGIASQFVVADMDADGDPDVVAGLDHGGMAPFGVHDNDGTGRFGWLGSQALFTNVRFLAIAAGDVDNDGDPDLLVGVATPPPVAALHVLRNDRGGVLVSLGTVPGVAAGRATFGDFDGDGDLDALLPQPANAPVLLDNQQGNLAPRAGFVPVDVVYLAFAAADLDGDGDLDALGLAADGSVFVLDNRAQRSLVRTTALAGQWDALALGDFDGDGAIDCATRRGDLVGVHRNLSNGTFARVDVLQRGRRCTALAAGDLDADGRLDLLTAWDGATGARVVALHGSSRGLFVDPHVDHDVQLDAPARFPLALGDIDRDGWLDLVLSINGNGLSPALGVQTNLGAQRFAPLRIPRIATDTALGLRLHDLDRDGDLDLVEHGRGAGAARYVRTFRRDPATWTDLGTIAGAGGACALGDLDGDGHTDLVTTWPWTTVHRNDGTGSFAPGVAQPSSSFASDARAIALGDLDGDGDLDMIAPHGSPNLDVLLNDGTGSFALAPNTALPFAATPWDLELADVDRDGDLDALLFAIPGNQPRLLRNDGTARFTDRSAFDLPAWSPGSAQIVDLLAFDADADADPDLLIVQTGAQTLWLNDGRGRFVDATAALWQQVQGGATEARAGDLDRDGDVDVVLDGRVQWNHTRQLASTGVPRAGGRADLRFVQDPGSAAPGSAMLGVLGLGALRSPLAIPGIRGTLQIDTLLPFATVPLAPSLPDGISTWSIPLPGSQALVGGELWFQGLASSQHGFGFTNALLARILP